MRKKYFNAQSGRILASTVAGAGLLMLCLLVLVSCAAQATDGQTTHGFTISSPDFKDGESLSKHNELAPNAHGCHGDNVAPTLQWTGVPAGTMSFALTMNDVDADRVGGFHHWVVFNIPSNQNELRNNPPYDQGTNSFPQAGYNGPCPPPDGKTHHYIFTLYALSVAHINGGKTLTYEQLLSEITPDVQGTTSIVGIYSRTGNT